MWKKICLHLMAALCGGSLFALHPLLIYLLTLLALLAMVHFGKVTGSLVYYDLLLGERKVLLVILFCWKYF